ncbi:hypothetical protein [Burkholderia glumae]|uniref:hypothetical protein n=1 Tax=Burkholderia glumae TaxID=337 RepID=UPI00214FA6E7|nr:hypothetical protein [Burkholderia glumae]
MRKLKAFVFSVAIIASGTATAADPEAFVLSSKPPAYGMIPASTIIYALMLHQPCTRLIPNANAMLAARLFNNLNHPERFDQGCWALTLDPSKAEVLVIGPTGHISTGMSLTQFTKATINASGDGTAIGPAMTHAEFMKNLQDYEKSLR